MSQLLNSVTSSFIEAVVLDTFKKISKIESAGVRHHWFAGSAFSKIKDPASTFLLTVSLPSGSYASESSFYFSHQTTDFNIMNKSRIPHLFLEVCSTMHEQRHVNLFHILTRVIQIHSSPSLHTANASNSRITQFWSWSLKMRYSLVAIVLDRKIFQSGVKFTCFSFGRRCVRQSNIGVVIYNIWAEMLALCLICSME